MQDEMIGEIEKAQPEYLLFVSMKVSWLPRAQSETRIFDWYKGYAEAHYDLVGVVDIANGEETVYRWDADAAAYAPRSSNAIFVFRRRPGA